MDGWFLFPYYIKVIIFTVHKKVCNNNKVCFTHLLLSYKCTVVLSSLLLVVISYRDIPMPLVSSGVEHGNLRELALARMKDLGTKVKIKRLPVPWVDWVLELIP